MVWLHTHELVFIEWLQQIRGPYLDLFFRSLNFFDTSGFYLIIIPVLWVGYYWKWGARFLFFLLISAMLNTVIKEICGLPRPYDLIPSLGLLNVGNYGFPSNAAQSAMMIAGIFIYVNRQKRWAWILGINYIFWISLSRLYLGVHFPTDVLGGWVLGALMILGFIYLLPKVEGWIDSKSLVTLSILTQGVPILLVALYPTEYFVLSNASIMGVSMGLILSKKFGQLLPKSKAFKEGFFRFILAFTGLIFLYYGMTAIRVVQPLGKLIINVIFCYGMGLWISVGFSYVWNCCPFLSKIKK